MNGMEAVSNSFTALRGMDQNIRKHQGQDGLHPLRGLEMKGREPARPWTPRWWCKKQVSRSKKENTKNRSLEMRMKN